ncbi:TOPRIM nucleotidyl transferase/hydrolase domain-containing protein [Paenibacillus sp. 23TSA30-6]|uniref:TOPRIM nucleotidyl transferase/hydrolase domain-containing protein n=1 Tax=Paenibacillus sp. 23TSA30-6 TaxID=2546104 RepID=UPI00192DFF27|nr:TOPRIM nucleotidyl transferase/hydrolase domain-containing protein [Paenibacillus sp. 23TSA30-6]
MDYIKEEYEKLISLAPNADAAAKRRRGFDFERLLNKMFSFEQLEPRTGYRPVGEQIDGSIYLDGRIYILEAKWHAEPLPASTLYQFKGKVEGKLAGTFGIFISMSGYAEDAVDALVLGKTLNIILFDKRDLDAAISRNIGFTNVLKLKLRKAAEEGAIYFPSEGELVTAEKKHVVEIDRLKFDSITGRVEAMQSVAVTSADLLIVCEGETDRDVIATLSKRILSNAGSNRSIKILVAMGKLTIPRVANALRNTFYTDSKVLIVVDGDGDPVRTKEMLEQGIEFDEWISTIPNPSIESWFEIDDNDLRRRMKYRSDQIRFAASVLDIVELQKRDAEFARFYNTILGL